MSTTCSDDVSELLLYGFISTMWIHLHNGSISIHSTWQLLVSIHIHAIFPNVSWSVMVPNPDRNDRKSTTGYIFFANNGAISWTSHRQTTVALSTMEAEYMSLSDSSREALARLQLFRDLHTYTDIPTIFSDNQGALTIATNPTDHQRAKHIDIRYHFIRNCIQNNSILIDYIPTASQTADILTKALPPILHERNIALIKFTNTTSSQSQFLV